jgi:hypothetical protein
MLFMFPCSEVLYFGCAEEIFAFVLHSMRTLASLFDSTGFVLFQLPSIGVYSGLLLIPRRSGIYTCNYVLYDSVPQLPVVNNEVESSVLINSTKVSKFKVS